MPAITRRLRDQLLATAGAAFLRLVRMTNRIERVGVETARPPDAGPVIYAFWHAQLAMMPWVQLGNLTAVPISRSADGEVTALLFRKLGVEPVRGSSSRGGAVAARALVAACRRGLDLGITPDGPRGPARVVQPGASWIARVSGRPLLPVAFACTRHRRLRSWDRMLVPLPFGRGVFVYGELLWVAPDADEEGLRRADAELARRLAEVTDRADALLLP